jgi:hypothetical protein
MKAQAMVARLSRVLETRHPHTKQRYERSPSGSIVKSGAVSLLRLHADVS